MTMTAGTTTMRFARRTITPQLAAEILARSEGAHQRPLGKFRVLRLAESIRRGEWQLTHQGIALDPDGVLLDGQHRLNAIILADTPVEMMVAEGVPADSFAVLDMGLSRGPSTTLALAGFTNTNILAAAARIVLTHREFNGRVGQWQYPNRMITTAQILDLMESDDGAIIRGNENTANRIAADLGRPGLRSPLLGTLSIIRLADVDREMFVSFWEHVETGAMLQPSDPALLLRRWLGNEYGYARTDRAVRAQTTVGICIYAWNLWVAGETRQALRYRPETDALPAVLTHRPNGANSEPDDQAHKMMIVEGEIEVCDTCVNSLGYPVAWELAHPDRETN